jgi:hypothetical protein
VAGVRAAIARMRHALLVLLLDLRLLVYRLREVREGIGEVMAGEAAPVRWHCCVWLSLESSCPIRSRRYISHTGAARERVQLLFRSDGVVVVSRLSSV